MLDAVSRTKEKETSAHTQSTLSLFVMGFFFYMALYINKAYSFTLHTVWTVAACSVIPRLHCIATGPGAAPWARIPPRGSGRNEARPAQAFIITLEICGYEARMENSLWKDNICHRNVLLLCDGGADERCRLFWPLSFSLCGRVVGRRSGSSLHRSVCALVCLQTSASLSASLRFTYFYFYSSTAFSGYLWACQLWACQSVWRCLGIGVCILRPIPLQTYWGPVN